MRHNISRYRIIRKEWISGSYEKLDVHFIVEEERRLGPFRWWFAAKEKSSQNKIVPIRFNSVRDIEDWINRKHANQLRPNRWWSSKLKIIEINNVKD
jgi:hypothetical protein